MDIIEIVKALLRQYKLVLALSILCIGIGGFAFSQIGSQYVATADIQILPNNGANTENPLDKLSRNQSTVAEMITVRLSSNYVRDGLLRQGLLGDYQVDSSATSGVSSDLPSITIRVTGPKSGPVDKTKQELIRRTSTELKNIQQEVGAPTETWLQTQVLTETKQPFLESGSRVKSLLVLIALSGAFIVSTTLVVDGVRNSQKNNLESKRSKNSKGETITIPLDETSTDEKPRRSKISKSL